MSIPTPATPAMTPKVRAFLYGLLGWLGVLAFLAFVGFTAAPNAEVPSWLNIANAVINGANLVFFVAKDNTPLAVAKPRREDGYLSLPISVPATLLFAWTIVLVVAVGIPWLLLT